MSGSLVSKRASSFPHYSPHHCSLLATKLDSHLLPSRDSICSSSHFFPLLLLLLQPVSVPATTPNNDHTEKLKPPVSGHATTPDNNHMERLKLGGVRREDTGPVRMTVLGASVEGDNSGGGNGGGNDASIHENGGPSKPKKRAVRADWYTFQFHGMMYHIRMNSSLGDTYRSLATKAEQREFAMEHGEAEPVWGRRVRAAR